MLRFSRFLLLLGVPPPNITAAQFAAAECLIYEDFNDSVIGAFPNGWSPRNSSGTTAYRVLVENGLRFVRGSAVKLGVPADKKRTWDIDRYPILRWRWRPRQFPVGAQEKDGENDSALGVYVGFSWLTGSIKYVWSEKLPVGTEFSSGLLGKTKMHVINTGIPSDRSEWVEVRVNVANDYKRRFIENNVENPAGIAVLTDSDDTGSIAEGDYADFHVCRK